MAKLYFRYGAMGSSKTANAIMVQYNYEERGQKVLMLKPKLENRDGAVIVRSRCGLETACRFIEDVTAADAQGYGCVIIDEAQFLTKAQVEMLVEMVDDYDVPVIAYGLRADFQNNFFEGSQWLMAWADTIEEIKTICWCGRKATCNARVVDGRVVQEGEQVVLGGNGQYVSLCRKHFRRGDWGTSRTCIWGRTDILIIKKAKRQTMQNGGLPLRFWECYCPKISSTRFTGLTYFQNLVQSW